MSKFIPSQTNKSIQFLKYFGNVRNITFFSVLFSVSLTALLVVLMDTGLRPSQYFFPIFCAAIVSGIVSFFMARLMNSYYQIIVQQQTELLEKNRLIREQEHEIAQAELQKIQQKAQHHQQQITTYVQVLTQKNQLIEALSQEVKALNIQNKQEESQKIQNISLLVESRLLSDNDWREFKRIFDEVHAGFFIRLKDKHPQLTPAEIRLSALIKLNLSTKEIADILAVSPKSVNVARYRLRKNLGLAKGTDVSEFVLGF